MAFCRNSNQFWWEAWIEKAEQLEKKRKKSKQSKLRTSIVIRIFKYVPRFFVILWLIYGQCSHSTNFIVNSAGVVYRYYSISFFDVSITNLNESNRIESHAHHSIFQIDKILFFVIKWGEQSIENKTGSNRYQYTPVARWFLLIILSSESWSNRFRCVYLRLHSTFGPNVSSYCCSQNIQIIGGAQKR